MLYCTEAVIVEVLHRVWIPLSTTSATSVLGGDRVVENCVTGITCAKVDCAINVVVLVMNTVEVLVEFAVT